MKEELKQMAAIIDDKYPDASEGEMKRLMFGGDPELTRLQNIIAKKVERVSVEDAN
jgi:hypothetical protein